MPFFDRPWALLLVLAIILIIWGPGKLPEVGAAIGRAMREFRRSSSELTDEIRKSAAVKDEDRPATQVTPPATQVTPPSDVMPSSEVRPPGDTKA